MEQQRTQWPTNYKKATVRMSDGPVMKGQINIGEYRRLSDLFKQTQDAFITMISKDSTGLDKVYVLNRNFITCVEAE